MNRTYFFSSFKPPFELVPDVLVLLAKDKPNNQKSGGEDETEEYLKTKAEMIGNSKKRVHMMTVGDESETKQGQRSQHSRLDLPARSRAGM